MKITVPVELHADRKPFLYIGEWKPSAPPGKGLSYDGCDCSSFGFPDTAKLVLSNPETFKNPEVNAAARSTMFPMNTGKTIQEIEQLWNVFGDQNIADCNANSAFCDSAVSGPTQKYNFRQDICKPSDMTPHSPAPPTVLHETFRMLSGIEFGDAQGINMWAHTMTFDVELNLETLMHFCGAPDGPHKVAKTQHVLANGVLRTTYTFGITYGVIQNSAVVPRHYVALSPSVDTVPRDQCGTHVEVTDLTVTPHTSCDQDVRIKWGVVDPPRAVYTTPFGTSLNFEPGKGQVTGSDHTKIKYVVSLEYNHLRLADTMYGPRLHESLLYAVQHPNSSLRFDWDLFKGPIGPSADPNDVINSTDPNTYDIFPTAKSVECYGTRVTRVRADGRSQVVVNDPHSSMIDDDSGVAFPCMDTDIDGLGARVCRYLIELETAVFPLRQDGSTFNSTCPNQLDGLGNPITITTVDSAAPQSVTQLRGLGQFGVRARPFLCLDGDEDSWHKLPSVAFPSNTNVDVWDLYSAKDAESNPYTCTRSCAHGQNGAQLDGVDIFAMVANVVPIAAHSPPVLPTGASFGVLSFHTNVLDAGLDNQGLESEANRDRADEILRSLACVQDGDCAFVDREGAVFGDVDLENCPLNPLSPVPNPVSNANFGATTVIFNRNHTQWRNVQTRAFAQMNTLVLQTAPADSVEVQATLERGALIQQWGSSPEQSAPSEFYLKLTVTDSDGTTVVKNEVKGHTFADLLDQMTAPSREMSSGTRWDGSAYERNQHYWGNPSLADTWDDRPTLPFIKQASEAKDFVGLDGFSFAVKPMHAFIVAILGGEGFSKGVSLSSVSLSLDVLHKPTTPGASSSRRLLSTNATCASDPDCDHVENVLHLEIQTGEDSCGTEGCPSICDLDISFDPDTQSQINNGTHAIDPEYIVVGSKIYRHGQKCDNGDLTDEDILLITLIVVLGVVVIGLVIGAAFWGCSSNSRNGYSAVDN